MNTHMLLAKLVQPDWWAALLIAAAFALVSKAARLLTRSGALATFAVGCIVLGLGGGKFLVPLLTFFLTSSLLSKFRKSRKAAAGASPKRGATRDYVQVLANGGVASALVVVFWATVRHAPVEVSRMLLMLYLAALATVNADTWATEIGGLSANPPRLLSNWRPAPAGTSGAVSALGFGASAAGSLVVTAAGWLVWRLNAPEFLAVLWAGFLGSFFDSILGASLQALYRHPGTGEHTERTMVEGVKTVRVRGFAFVTNDVVNFLASAAGVVCAWILLHFAYAAQ